MPMQAGTLVYRHTRLGILTEGSADVVDLTEGLWSLLADTALTSGVVNLRSFGGGTRIVVARADSAPPPDPGAVATGASLSIVDGRLQLDARERVLLIDLDGPGAREIAVVIVGEGRR